MHLHPHPPCVVPCQVSGLCLWPLQRAPAQENNFSLVHMSKHVFKRTPSNGQLYTVWILWISPFRQVPSPHHGGNAIDSLHIREWCCLMWLFIFTAAALDSGISCLLIGIHSTGFPCGSQVPAMLIRHACRLQILQSENLLQVEERHEGR